MIPWRIFEKKANLNLREEPRIQFHEQWLPWVEPGPSKMADFITTPMLEIAHERQFVVSQQGGESVGFETDHTQRIDECLKNLDSHFHAHELQAYHHPISPCGVDLVHCWMPQIPWNEFPPLHLSSDQTKSVQSHDTPVASAQSPASSSSIVSSVAPTVVFAPELSPEEIEIPEVRAQQLRLGIPRAGSTLSANGTRASKEIRQRKKHESKFLMDAVPNDKKRSSQWMVDAHEDGIAIAMRSQSIASLRTGHNRHRDTASLTRIPRPVEDT